MLAVNPKDCKELKCLLDNLIEALKEYMEEEGVKYKRKHVKKCAYIINLFLEEISDAKNKKVAISLVKKTVIQLNELNDFCIPALIQSMEREDLCEIINTACSMKGYSEKGEDLTEEWRTW